MSYVSIDIDVDDVMDELSNSDLLEELDKRTLNESEFNILYKMLKSGSIEKKSLIDVMRDEFLEEVKNKYSLFELQQLLTR